MIEYECFHPKLDKPAHLAGRNEARDAYDWFVEKVPERIEILKAFMKNRDHLVLEGRDFLRVLNDFYFEVCSKINDHENLGPLELSLASDINMYIGDMLVQKFENLHWGFHTFGESDVNYQRPVVMGFSKASNKNYSREFLRPVSGYAVRIVQGKPKEDDLLIKLYDSCVKFA